MKQDKTFFDALTCTSVQVYPFKNPTGKAKAYASVVLNEQLTLTSFRVVNGENGFFVAYPSNPGKKENEYNKVFFPLKRELWEHIEKCILEKFHKMDTREAAGNKNETKKEEV